MIALPIHLPWLITLHATGLCFLCFSMIFKTAPPDRPSDRTTILGIATLALGLTYFIHLLHANLGKRVPPCKCSGEDYPGSYGSCQSFIGSGY